jgi:signal transduction histidine kinase
VSTAVAFDTLFGLLKKRRGDLISRWGTRIGAMLVAARLTQAELLDRIPTFVDEIIRALHPAALPLPPNAETAEEHGEQRLRLGFDVAEVIREYGLLHECILQLAEEAGLALCHHEQEVIAKGLNAGIASAVAQYVSQRDEELRRRTSQHIGFIAHELRNPLSAARLAFQTLRRREIGASRTADVMDRNLQRMVEMVDSVLHDAAMKMGVEAIPSRLVLAAFLRDIASDADVEAQSKRIRTTISVPDNLTIEADPRLLRSAVSNLLLNAIKFSHQDGAVSLVARQGHGRLTIDVEDRCGGLPAGKSEDLFAPLVQRGDDRSGFGLGLAIARQAAEAHNGTIRVRDLPGVGCVFTLDLPA